MGEAPYVYHKEDFYKSIGEMNTDLRDFTEGLPMSAVLQRFLRDMGIGAYIAGISKNPSVVRYELKLERGVQIKTLLRLERDIGMAMMAPENKVRIQAPIPGKRLAGIEVPREKRKRIGLRTLLESDVFAASQAELPFIVGVNFEGNIVVEDLAALSHLLVTGSPGSGAAVFLYGLIFSLLCAVKPEDMKLLMIDTSSIYFNEFEDIPHLLRPVVTERRKAISALDWLEQEMVRRFRMFSDSRVRKFEAYNAAVKAEEEKTGDEEAAGRMPLPRIVAVIDVLEELMHFDREQVENRLVRLLQLGAAAGIHLVLVTQQPTVNVITGLNKINIPARISFAVTSKNESNVVMEMPGAEKLLGEGDMLFRHPGLKGIERIQGAYISDKEISKMIRELKAGNEASV